jgi:tetratricopeptide (TPR) repeat protein
MPCIVQGYEYDIFISYRQKDNQYDGWVTEFVDNLKRELDSTFKEEISVYFDFNSHDGLLETHDVNASLKEKLKCLIFIPIISQTYCNLRSFAWQHEFCVFNKVANAVKEIIGSLKRFSSTNSKSSVPLIPVKKTIKGKFKNTSNSLKILFAPVSIIVVISAALLLNKYYFSEKSSIYLFTLLSLLIIALAALLLNKYYLTEKGPEDEYKRNITTNPEAYDWFKKAEFRLTPEDNCDIDSGIYFLKKAIDADSSFGLAHAELSRAYSFKNYFIDPNSRFDEKAFVEAEKSLYLNPDLAEGYFAKAYCTWTFQNKFPHEKVIREYKKAISFKPDLDEAYHYLGVVYMHVGLMQESIDTIKKAVQINPDNKIASLDLITYYFLIGKKPDLEKTIDLFKHTPDHLLSPIRASFLAIALITLDRYFEADNILSAGIKRISSDLFLNNALAIFLAKNDD